MKNKTDCVLLGVAEMMRADELAVEAGIAGNALMENAGRAVAETAMSRWRDAHDVVVLCGPGNNGGDGFVAARYLKQAGWTVNLHCLVPVEKLAGDAAHHARRWLDEENGLIQTLQSLSLDQGPLVIDALFGAGLARPVEGELAAIIQQVNKNTGGCLSVDLPSGVSGDTGDILGTAIRADCSVTFFRLKPGHLLYPGAPLCGQVIVADIATPPDVLEIIKPSTFHNDPVLWWDGFPVPGADGHKYDRGHAVVYGGDAMIGAARLAARAARRAGAGVSSIICTPERFDLYSAADPGTIVEPVEHVAAFCELLADKRRNCIAIGPGAGVNTRTRDFTIAALQSGKPVVLDADAMSVFSHDPAELFALLHANCILTPHDGEFARLFSSDGDKLARTRRAAVQSGAVVILKGADTVIAAPAASAASTGRATINTNAPPDLATAGAGDVLVGIIAGLLSQNMETYAAACAGVWIHGQCANLLGPGLIAEDLCEKLPVVLHELRSE